VSVTTERPASTQSVSATDAPAVQRRRIPWIPVAVGALAVITVGVIASWNQPQSAAPAPVEWSSGYGVGSSVYSEQVPRAATGSDAADSWAEMYGPGSSTYAEQVPTPARVRPSTDGYGPGSTTYSEQVPSSATAAVRADYWAYAYGPGSSTYPEQVPPAAPIRPWTDSYGPGSATYAEQVPRG
jgi:hypothetical protein